MSNIFISCCRFVSDSTFQIFNVTYKGKIHVACFIQWLPKRGYGYRILPIPCTQQYHYHLKCKKHSRECASRTGYFWHYGLLPAGLGLSFVRKLFAYSSILHRHLASHDFLLCESCAKSTVVNSCFFIFILISAIVIM